MPEDVVIWQMPRVLRVLAFVLGGPLILLLLIESVRNPGGAWAYLVVAVLLLGAVSSAWRSCRVDDRRIVARGRTGACRTVELADLRQVAEGFGMLWVQTHDPLDGRGNDVLGLRMIGPSSFTGLLPRNQAVGLIRERAERAGATMDPPVPNPTNPPSRKPLLFSI